MAQQDRVRPLWLPAYAPELNLIERVWRHLKDKLSCHRWWADLPAREVAAAALLADRGALSPARPGRHRPGPELLSGCLGRVCKPRGVAAM